MPTTAIADIICAVFLCILYARRFSDRKISKSNRVLNICLMLMMLTLIDDALAYTLVGPSYPLALRYLLNFLTFIGTCVNSIAFAYYMEALISERTKPNPWFFRILRAVEFAWTFVTAYEFIAGHLLSYENGIENFNYVYPTYITVIQVAILIYQPVVALIYRKSIGKELTLLFLFFCIAPLLSTFLYVFLAIDFAYVLGAVSLGLISEFIQKKHTEIILTEQDKILELANQQRYMKSFGDMVNAALWSMTVNDSNKIASAVWSDELRHMLGFESAEDFPNTREAFVNRIHPDDREKTVESFNKCLGNIDTGNYSYEGEFRLQRKNGSYFWYRSVGRIEKDRDGTRKLYGIGFDISTEKELEEQQAKTREALEMANRESLRNEIVMHQISANKWSYSVSADDEVIDSKYSEKHLEQADVYHEGRPMAWVDYLHPDDRERVLSEFMGAVKDHSGNTAYDATFRVMGRDGKYRWAKSAGKVLRREDGSGEFIGMSLDITDQMEEQQRRLLGAIPVSPDILTKTNIGMWAFELDDGEAPRMYADEAMLRLLGLEHQLPPEEIYHAWYDHIDEGSYDLVSDAVSKMAAGEHAEVQYPWHHPDGHTMMVRCGGVLNPKYKKGIRIEGTHQDVSEVMYFDEEERKAAKRQKIELVKSNLRGDALKFLEDNEPDIHTFMEFFGNRILDISGADQVIFRNIKGERIVINAKGIKEVPDEICSDCPFLKFDGSLFKDGSVLMNDCSKGYNGVMTHEGCPVKSTFMQQIYLGGNLVGLLAVHYHKKQHTFTEDGIDIMKTIATYLGLVIGRIDAKKAEQAKLEADASSKAKTEFLFNMSHDIRTPMNAITGFTDKAIRHMDDEETLKDTLGKVKSSSEYLLRIVNDILDMAKIESGKLELNENLHEFEEGKNAMLEVFGADAARKDIKLHSSYDIRDRYMWLDESRTSQIIANLLSNSIKYTNQGGDIWYSVKQIPCDREGYGKYVMTVKDTGCGMSPEFVAKIFDEFERDTSAVKKGIQGTGLGMSIVKKLVDAMEGTIEIDSTPGKGTEIRFTAEHRLATLEEIEKYESEKQKKEEYENISFKGRRVLLVEDNELNREIADDILEEEGFDVENAEDGSIAVKKLMDKGPGYYDFVLMDIQMPVMNGYQATKAIREMYPDVRIPIIALSANAFAEDKAVSIEAGMDDHVAKPIKKEELFAALARLL